MSFGMTTTRSTLPIPLSHRVLASSLAIATTDEAGTGASVFCSRITRDLSDPTDPAIVFMDLGFINRDLETARGIDYNLFFRDQFNLGAPVDVSLNVTASRLLERSTGVH